MQKFKQQTHTHYQLTKYKIKFNLNRSYFIFYKTNTGKRSTVGEAEVGGNTPLLSLPPKQL